MSSSTKSNRTHKNSIKNEEKTNYLSFLHLQMLCWKTWRCSDTAEVYPLRPGAVQDMEAMVSKADLYILDDIEWQQSRDAQRAEVP